MHGRCVWRRPFHLLRLLLELLFFDFFDDFFFSSSESEELLLLLDESDDSEPLSSLLLSSSSFLVLFLDPPPPPDAGDFLERLADGVTDLSLLWKGSWSLSQFYSLSSTRMVAKIVNCRACLLQRSLLFLPLRTSRLVVCKTPPK